MRCIVIALLEIALVAGCGSGSDSDDDDDDAGVTIDTAPGSIALPPANGALDYQLGGAYAPPTGVTVIARDRKAAPATGVYNICYVNGFQIQPDEEQFFLDNHPELVLRNANNQPVIDVEWNEMLIDISTAAKRDATATIVGGWIAGCKTAGFDAIEIDNLDSFTRSQNLLSEANAVATMALFSKAAHDQGMAIGQKNSAELVPRKAELGTDFAVSEECNRYSECGDYKVGYGDHVFVIEYRRQDFTAGCAAFPELSIVLRDLNLVTPTQAGYVFEGC